MGSAHEENMLYTQAPAPLLPLQIVQMQKAP